MDPAAQSLVQAAVNEASAAHDTQTEAEASLLLLGFDGTSPADAQRLASRALQLAHENHFAFLEANALSELGLSLLDHEHYAAAVPYLLQTVSQAHNLQAHFLEVSSLANLAQCYFSLGNLDQALQTLAQAQPLLRSADPASLRIGVNTDLGRLYSLRQQNDQAIRYFREAFNIAQPLTHGENYIGCANNLAQALIQTHSPGNLQQASQINDSASEAITGIHPATWDLTAPNELNRADLASEQGRLPDAQASYRKVLQLLLHAPTNPVQWSAYAGLAEVEERLHNFPEARRNFERALSTIESIRSAQNEAKYQITFLSALIRFYQQYVDFLIEHHDPWQALAVADSSRAGVLTQGLHSSRSDPGFAARIHREARAARCSLLFYWLAPSRSYVWLITPSGDAYANLPPKSEIEHDVERYSEFIADRQRDTLADLTPTGFSLYKTLITPVATHLTPGSRVVVVPDGALNGLNFETLLVDAARPHYWIQDVTLTVAPSLRILLDRSKRDPAPDKALIVGDATYAGSNYAPLPESRREIEEVHARFPKGSTVLTQQNALASAYQNAHPERFSLIHFSAHVEANSLSPLDSAIILSPDEYGIRRLYARDVMKCPLHADLVTVSGCRSTGAKALSGEGMVGFAWAAFEAGARNAVTSLWAVDDRSTTDLMDNFYAGVTAGNPYAAALRQAKLQMLHTAFRKPYYWAPFQLYSRNLQP